MGTTSCPSKRRTTSTESVELVDSEERELRSTSSFPRMPVSSRTFRTITIRRSTRCQPISTSCEHLSANSAIIGPQGCLQATLRSVTSDIVRDFTERQNFTEKVSNAPDYSIY